LFSFERACVLDVMFHILYLLTVFSIP
jgi:hypothetical protein